MWFSNGVSQKKRGNTAKLKQQNKSPETDPKDTEVYELSNKTFITELRKTTYK